MRKLEAEGRTLAEAQAPIKDTWRPTKLSEDGRRITEAPKHRTFQQSRGVAWGTSAESAAAPVQKPLPPTTRTQNSNQRPQSGIASSDMPPGSILSTGPSAAQQPPRGSRFFPSRDIRYEAGATENQRQQNSPSPPPPDMDGHPAFDGDVARPQVSLPRPQPVVRLPPTPGAVSGSANQPIEGGPSFDWAVPKPYQHEAGQPVSRHVPTAPRGPSQAQGSNWQDRIDSLLGGRKGPSPPKLLPVDSASRSSLEHHRYRNTATISLPSPLTTTAPAPDKDRSVTSKGMAEECFEEQEMGSVPPVRLPNKVPESAWQLCPAPKPLPKRLLATILSIEPLTFPNEISGGSPVLRVFVPGMVETKNLALPFSRTRSNPRRAPRGGRHPSQAHRSGKPRDASSSYPNDQGASSSGRPPSRAGRGGGGSFRGRDNWSRNASNPIQT